MSRQDNLDKGIPTRFGNGQDTKKGGRPPSIKKELHELLQEDGKITFDAKQVISIDYDEDGVMVSVTLKLPTKKQIATRLMSIALTGKGSVTMSAIKEILYRTDGNEPIKNTHDLEDGLINQITTYQLPDNGRANKKQQDMDEDNGAETDEDSTP